MRGGGSLWCRRCSAALRQAVLPIPAEYQPTGAAGTRRAPGFSGIAAVAAVADHHGVAAGSTLAAGGAIPAGATVHRRSPYSPALPPRRRSRPVELEAAYYAQRQRPAAG